MNLAQISSGMSGRGAGLLTSMLEEAPALQFAEFQSEASDHLLATARETATGSSSRNEGDTAHRNAVVPDVTPRKLRLYSREVTVDNVRIQDVRNGITAPAGLKNFYDRQLKVEANGLADDLQNDLFAGTDAADVAGKIHMLGFSEFLKDAVAAGQTARFGFSTADIAAMNVQAALKLDTDENQSAFVELLYKVLAQIPGANAIQCNVNLAARLTTIAKKLGAAGESINSFGTKASTFNGIPIIPVPVTTISQSESDGVNADCTSLYAIRYQEDTGVAVTTNSGILFADFAESSELPSGIARIEFFGNLAVQSRNSLRRISRIRL